jgi:hypothetical protein
VGEAETSAADAAEQRARETPGNERVADGSSGSEASSGDSAGRTIAQGEDRYALIGNRQFVRFSDGGLDSGVIREDVAQAGRVPGGPIRLPRGDQRNGELHMNREPRASEIRDAGYRDAASLVEDVATNYTHVYRSRDGLGVILVKTPREGGSRLPTIYIRLERSLDGSTWEVTSGGNFNQQVLQQHREQIWPPRGRPG